MLCSKLGTNIKKYQKMLEDRKHFNIDFKGKNKNVNF